MSSDVDYSDRQHVILVSVSCYIHYVSVLKSDEFSALLIDARGLWPILSSSSICDSE